MLIQCLIPRSEAVEILTSDNTPYWFRHVNGEGTPMVCEIENPTHCKELLAITEGYAKINPDTMETIKAAPPPPVEPQKEPSDADPLQGRNVEDLDEAELRAAAEALHMRAWPKNIRIDTMRRHIKEQLQQNHQDDVDELNGGDGDGDGTATETPTGDTPPTSTGATA